MSLIWFIIGVTLGLLFYVEIKTEDFSFESKNILEKIDLTKVKNTLDTSKKLMYSNDCSYLKDMTVEEASNMVETREAYDMWMIGFKMREEGLDPSDYVVLDVLGNGTYSILSKNFKHLFGAKFVGEEMIPFYQSKNHKYNVEDIYVTETIRESMQETFERNIIKI